MKCIDDEIPFEIPASWEWTRLGFLGDWGSGSTPAKGNSAYYGGDILWLRTGELNNGIVYDTEIKITQKALKECSFRLNKEGDVLIAMYGATIGKLAIAGAPMTTNQACCGCTPIIINNKFLFYYLMAVKDALVQQGEGGAQPNISREKIVKFTIPLPPLAEQNRIVHQIESIIPFVELYGTYQSKLNNLNKDVIPKLRKSILQEAIQGKLVPQDPNDEPASVLLERIRAEKERLIKEKKIKRDKNESVIYRGDDNSYYEMVRGKTLCINDEIPFDIPVSWTWARGKSVFLQMESTHAKGEHFCYIDLDAVDNKQNVITRPKYLRSNQTPSRATRKLHTNDILFSLVRPYLRNIALVDATHSKSIASTGFYVITPNECLYPQYVFYLMLSNYVVDGLNQFMRGDNSPSINNAHIENWLYPLPPLVEQRRIVSRIQELSAYFQ